MVTVEPFGICPVDVAEFVELGRRHVFERLDKTWLKYNLSQTVP
jgi:hypothetical protein